MQILFIIGILFCVISIALLVYFAIQSLKIRSINPEDRPSLTNRLIAINFGAIALATLGLILVFFSLKFKP